MPNNEFGDFQTPLALAQALVKTLPARSWARVLEPTCGTGSFLRAAVDVFGDAEVIGVETQHTHVVVARDITTVLHANIFELDLEHEVPWTSPPGPTLIIGNPPWVTNTQLSSLGSANRPRRSNFKGASGIDAITGSSNFDIAEYIWTSLLDHYNGQDAMIALICKTQVARNVLLHCERLGLPVTGASIRGVDAKKWFGAAVDACWFTIELGTGATRYTAEIYPDTESALPGAGIGVFDGKLVSDVEAYDRSKAFDGQCPMTWRQGVKHDASTAMELGDDDGPTTAAGLGVDIESEYLYPLFKCTDVYRNRLEHVRRWMVVPQQHPGADTAALEHSAPKLWRYLHAHGAQLDGRKSSIYRNRPRFAIFGVGDYTFTPYKIAISGFHKAPAFRIVGPRAGKPVVFDDATYLLPFADVIDCAAVHALLTGPETADLITSLVFWDAKRPVTKKLLQRIDLRAIAHATNRVAHADRALAELAHLGVSATSGEITASLGRLVQSWKPPGDQLC